MPSTKLFQNVSGLNPRKSAFDLSYSKLFNCDAGQLIPVQVDEVVPGDHWHMSNEIVIRQQALVAPVLHEINCYVHTFFVPNRIMWDDWEKFITGDFDGNDTTPIPRWEPLSADTAKYSLWDYFGFRLGANVVPGYKYAPIDMGLRAYNMVWNEWFRDETLQTEVALTQFADVLLRNWEKDYFTISLPFQQRGTAPALPISGTTSAVFPTANFENATADAVFSIPSAASNPNFRIDGSAPRDNAENAFNDNTVDLSAATTFDVADLRLATQIQRWLERNARAGARYTEFLKAHFGVSPKDDRLQRPEYIGGTKQSIIVSEVLQTSETGTSPQGNLAGHGLTADGQQVGSYRVEEYGIIISLLSIMPRTAYSQGVNRQWLKETRYDYYHPEFAHLSEQPVLSAELYYTSVEASDGLVFGYQGRYDEMRTKMDIFCGDMRTVFEYWHLGRVFSTPPTLTSDFIECNSVNDDLVRIFAVQSEPGYIVHIANKITAVRPMPIASDPGYMDS